MTRSARTLLTLVALAVSTALGVVAPPSTDATLAAGAVTSAQAPAVPSPSAPFFAGRRLFVGENSAVRAQRAVPPADTVRASRLRMISTQPQAEWLGDWISTSTVGPYVRALGVAASAQKAVLPLVVYAIPGRDCGSYSAGGAADAVAYRRWVDAVATALKGVDAIVVVEPDALAGISCLDAAARLSRLQSLQYAVGRLTANPRTAVYLDAGNSGWQSPETMAELLRSAGVAGARGFSLNVSNFFTTGSQVAYGKQISRLLGATPFVIDTSRNGNGPASLPGVSGWCNPPGRALGTPPTTATGDPLVDALLWIKHPGESDGACGRGAPAAGQWWEAYALDLARAVPTAR